MSDSKANRKQRLSPGTEVQVSHAWGGWKLEPFQKGARCFTKAKLERSFYKVERHGLVNIPEAHDVFSILWKDQPATRSAATSPLSSASALLDALCSCNWTLAAKGLWAMGLFCFGS